MNDKVREKCTVSITGEHTFTLDVTGQANKSEFSCICGEQVTEYEDCGTGA